MQTYFIISLCVAIFGLLGGLLNMGVAVKCGLSSNNVIAHIGFVACWVIGGICTLVFGVLWAIQHFSA